MKVRRRLNGRRECALGLILIVLAITMVAGSVFGCAEARRSYRYSVVTLPDGSVTKAVDIQIVNSDVKVGQLEAIGADGTTIKINDLDAQERASVIIQTQAEAMGRAFDALKPDLPLP